MSKTPTANELFMGFWQASFSKEDEGTGTNICPGEAGFRHSDCIGEWVDAWRDCVQLAEALATEAHQPMRDVVAAADVVKRDPLTLEEIKAMVNRG